MFKKSNLLTKYVSLHTKFAAFGHLLEGQFLRARENWVKFLMLQEGTQSVLSIKEAQHFDPRKRRMR